MNIARQTLQVVERLFRTQIASDQDVMNPARHQKLLEFARNRLRPEVGQKTKTIRFAQFNFSVFYLKGICKSPKTNTS